MIDHSTTTTEAASHQGGRSDRGGDLLFRWENPRVYRSGTNVDQQLEKIWTDEQENRFKEMEVKFLNARSRGFGRLGGPDRGPGGRSGPGGAVDLEASSAAIDMGQTLPVSWAGN